MDKKNIFLMEDWWMDDQKELVQDSSLNWQRKTFAVIPGFWHTLNGNLLLSKLSEHVTLPQDAKIDYKAWDHEHCRLCWQKISENKEDQPEGYNNGDGWICIDCYNKYIAPGNLL